VQPFLGAFAARVAGVMPTYSVLADLKVNGQPIEPVGAGFNHYLLTDLLRDKYHLARESGMSRSHFTAHSPDNFAGNTWAWKACDPRGK
jgi:hypothetical protein